MKPAPASFAACIPMRGPHHAFEVAGRFGGALVIWQEIAGALHLRLCRRQDGPPAESIAVELRSDWDYRRVVKEIKDARKRLEDSRKRDQSRRPAGAARSRRGGPPPG